MSGILQCQASQLHLSSHIYGIEPIADASPAIVLSLPDHAIEHSARILISPDPERGTAAIDILIPSRLLLGVIEKCIVGGSKLHTFQVAGFNPLGIQKSVGTPKSELSCTASHGIETD